MNPYLPKVLALGLLVAVTGATGCAGVGAQPAADDNGGGLPFSKSEGLELTKGTAIYVHLQQSISSATAQNGDSFAAILDEPLMVNGRTVAPSGAPVKGRVVAVRKSGHLRDAGYLRLTLCAITLNGKEVPIETTSMFVEGGSFRKRNLAYTGGGIGGNSVIGPFAGGKGTVIGPTVGPVSGTTAAYAMGNKEVGFAAERKMGFRLIQPLNIS